MHYKAFNFLFLIFMAYISLGNGFNEMVIPLMKGQARNVWKG